MGSDPISFLDAQGTRHAPAGPGARIACLVPSITELVCALGLTDRLVARTGFCIYPRAALAEVPKVGGTKDLNIARLRELAPTHAIVNIDENRKPDAQELARFIPHLIVTHPQGPEDNPVLYRLIGGIFGATAAAESLCRDFEAAWREASAACAALPRERVLYLIWKDPWMGVARDTYISRTLAAVGWDTLPAQAERRYPDLTLDALPAGTARVLLSSEPYSFTARHAEDLAHRFPATSVNLIDGEMTSWYGPRAIAGFRYLARLRQSLANQGDARVSNP
ncbi:MAG: ABC transporter substrate-binding protein [Burkholderiales bacterium]|nr:ABC transporter substrate-binding protein [Burkholderiales bacterium]